MSPSERNPDCRVARAAVTALLWLVVSSLASGQADPDQPQSRGIIGIGPGQTYTERVDIPGTSREQQESELAAQRAAGCSTKVLDPRTLALLEPYLDGLVAQSNYAITHIGRIPHTPANDAEWGAVSHEAGRLQYRLEALYEDRSPAADRALAYLLRFHFLYTEFADDSIDCELVLRGALAREVRPTVRPKRSEVTRVRQLLKDMRRCVPLTGREPYPHQMVLPMEEVRRRIRELPHACERHPDE
jgi:hypothetical protein